MLVTGCATGAIVGQTPRRSSILRPPAVIVEARPARPAPGGAASTSVTAMSGDERLSASARLKPDLSAAGDQHVVRGLRRVRHAP